MKSPLEDLLRRRLVEISDEIRALRDDDFAAKYPLHIEFDDLRRQLESFAGENDDELLRTWADRSGRKGSHTTDYELKAAQAAIPSPIHV